MTIKEVVKKWAFETNGDFEELIKSLEEFVEKEVKNWAVTQEQIEDSDYLIQYRLIGTKEVEDKCSQKQ